MKRKDSIREKSFAPLNSEAGYAAEPQPSLTPVSSKEEELPAPIHPCRSGSRFTWAQEQALPADAPSSQATASSESPSEDEESASLSSITTLVTNSALPTAPPTSPTILFRSAPRSSQQPPPIELDELLTITHAPILLENSSSDFLEAEIFWFADGKFSLAENNCCAACQNKTRLLHQISNNNTPAQHVLVDFNCLEQFLEGGGKMRVEEIPLSTEAALSLAQDIERFQKTVDFIPRCKN